MSAGRCRPPGYGSPLGARSDAAAGSRPATAAPARWIRAPNSRQKAANSGGSTTRYGKPSSIAAANRVSPALFSANSTGACPACRGRGTQTTDLAFLEPVTRVCEACGGSRYRPEALRYRLHGLTIAETMGLTATEAARRFTDERITGPLGRLVEVGVGHLTLARQLDTLSGGERQRLKLAAELEQGGGLYLLDEPTSGLHLADVATLLRILNRLVEQGNTVVVVEHHPHVVCAADWVIEVGPGAGRHGGRITFAGAPEQLLRAETPTGAALRAASGEVR